MPVFIAMLRGVNLGPHKRMKMEKLRSSCEALRLEQVKTYIQSGNVVFRAAKQDPASLAKKMEDRIVQDFGFSSKVVIRTADQMSRVIRNNPLLRRTGVDADKLHVTFLPLVPAAAAIKKLNMLPQQDDQFCCVKAEVYLYCPNGLGQCKLPNNFFEKHLAAGGTTRNWRTVNTLYSMAQECGD